VRTRGGGTGGGDGEVSSLELELVAESAPPAGATEDPEESSTGADSAGEWGDGGAEPAEDAPDGAPWFGAGVCSPR
jgi:hypothetical protein